MGNTYFEHKNLHKYTKVTRGKDHDRSSAVLCAGYEGNGRNGKDLSDHHVVVCKVRLVGPWIKKRGSGCS